MTPQIDLYAVILLLGAAHGRFLTLEVIHKFVLDIPWQFSVEQRLMVGERIKLCLE
jgi:hypothetical protein